ncbi:MAG: anti-sigma factor family protein [Rubripirellula sp.]
MKPTQEEIDQLLSGYLDDALDATELKQVKDWLNHDAEIISRHRELVDMRRTMKELFKVAPSKQLADSFSMQVLSAAVTRAHEEGVDESHPLMRVQEQPFTQLNTIPAQVSTRRLMMVTLTLAASLFGLIFGMDFLDRQEIIQQPLVSQNALPVDVIAPPADLANDQKVGGFPPNPTSTSDAVENSLLASGERLKVLWRAGRYLKANRPARGFLSLFKMPRHPVVWRNPVNQ